MSEEEVCNNTTIEPVLQLISGEILSITTAISEDRACLDIAAVIWFLGVSLKEPLRRFHMGTLMRIECASDPDRLRSHECALT